MANLTKWGQMTMNGSTKFYKWMMTVPPKPKIRPETVKVEDLTRMPLTREGKLEDLPESYRLEHPEDKTWAPVMPDQWKFHYYHNIIEEPASNNYRGKLSTLFVGFLLFCWYNDLKRDKELLGFRHAPPECLRIV